MCLNEFIKLLKPLIYFLTAGTFESYGCSVQVLLQFEIKHLLKVFTGRCCGTAVKPLPEMLDPILKH